MPITTTLEEKGEPKGNRTEVLLLTSKSYCHPGLIRTVSPVNSELSLSTVLLVHTLFHRQQIYNISSDSHPGQIITVSPVNSCSNRLFSWYILSSSQQINNTFIDFLPGIQPRSPVNREIMNAGLIDSYLGLLSSTVSSPQLYIYYLPPSTDK